MLSYLVHFIHAFLPAALMVGLLAAFWPPAGGTKPLRSLLAVFGVGLLAGIAVYFGSLRQEVLTAARVSLYGTAIVAVLLNFGLLAALQRSRMAARAAWMASLLVSATLAAAAMFSFCIRVTEEAMSTTAVLNTELILNLGGIVCGAVIAACVIPLTAHLAGRVSAGMVTGLTGAASLLLIVPWSADALLGLMRLEMAGLTSARLSFVAKITKYLFLLPYLHMAILALLALLFFRKCAAVEPAECTAREKSEQRKARSLALRELRWYKFALACVGTVVAVLLFFDLYASRPPKLSPAIAMNPDSSGMIRVRTADIADGNLHRYSYVTDDGHVVRFFLITSTGSGGRGKVGVVFDACMLCGDMGYLQNKKEIICIACNVRMFVPTIGKEGGCNPIPLKHTLEGDAIVIAARDLDQGARYFSEVISVKVKDPVTGKELDNLKAPHRYEYKGHIFFFESEQSLEKFKASPDSFVGDLTSRYYRAQGYTPS